MVKYLNTAEIEAALPSIQESPADEGTVQMIVARPSEGTRDVLDEGLFSPENGLEGDNWQQRGSKHTADGSAHPDMQIAMTNVRFLDVIAGDKARWPLAGDQLVVDLNLGIENLQPGQRLQMGTAVFEVTPVPHNGCKKFTDRYGMDAVKYANSANGKEMRLRGIYVKVVQPGKVQAGDVITKI